MAEIEIEIEEEYTVLKIELEMISTVADKYIEAAKERNVDEGVIVAKILEVIANNDGMIEALLEDE